MALFGKKKEEKIRETEEIDSVDLIQVGKTKNKVKSKSAKTKKSNASENVSTKRAYGKQPISSIRRRKNATPKKKVAAKVALVKITPDTNLSWVLRQTRITEKASITPETVNAYVFEVHPDANSIQIKKAIQDTYKVKPIKVNTLRIPSKKVSRQRKKGVRKGVKGGGKKAYVYLKKGDRIEFV